MTEEVKKNYFQKKAEEFGVFSWDQDGKSKLDGCKFKAMVQQLEFEQIKVFSELGSLVEKEGGE